MGKINGNVLSSNAPVLGPGCRSEYLGWIRGYAKNSAARVGRGPSGEVVSIPRDLLGFCSPRVLCKMSDGVAAFARWMCVVSRKRATDALWPLRCFLPRGTLRFTQVAARSYTCVACSSNLSTWASVFCSANLWLKVAREWVQSENYFWRVHVSNC